MHPTAHLLTCAGREGVLADTLADTLADLARTDWPEAPQVHAVPWEPDDPTGSTGRGHPGLLRTALDGSGTPDSEPGIGFYQPGHSFGCVLLRLAPSPAP